MARLVPEPDWRPVGVDDLEPTAEAVIRSNETRLVVAGPGAGKTELLAQKASFLLETGRCPSPHRILAISFKRDAAKNLEARVRERCAEHVRRFDSFTLDAFAKQIVDRFLPALPPSWRPNSQYEVSTASLRHDEAEQWLLHAELPPGERRPGIRGWQRDRVRRAMDRIMHGSELPYDGDDVHALVRAWGLQWWREQLSRPAGTPSLTFPMLSRLAAYLLQLNPKITSALRQTYSEVFLDEFQDTTSAQWDLIRSAFRGSGAAVTAVGDSKQRIMVWAGAKKDIFEDFLADFGAERVDLLRNYRSAPELVRMQHVIAQAVEAGAVEPEVSATGTAAGTCQLLEFRDPEQEAIHLAELIREDLAAGRSSPRDYGILARQRVPAMIEPLRRELAARGVRLRDESQLQDLRAEPVTDVVLPALRLATRPRDPEAWVLLVDQLSALSGLEEGRDGAELERLASIHKACAEEVVAGDGGLAQLPHELVKLLGEDRYRSTYRQYMRGEYLSGVLDNLGEALDASLAAAGEAPGVPEDLAGADTVPAMTIHKSKGLEFRTVIFLGLEDGQWWAFRNQPEEERRAFFVAFSRAIDRVLFTWSDVRDDARFGRRAQSRDGVGALHEILAKAGVPAVDER